MGSWHSPQLFHTPVRARSCCGMKSLLILLSDLFSLSHTHEHTSTHLVRSPSLLSAVPLSSLVLHGAFPSLQPLLSSSSSCSCLVWVLRPSWGLCLGPAWAPSSEKGWWQGQVLAGTPLWREGAGGYQRAQDLLPVVKDPAFPSTRCQKHSCWTHTTDHSTWGPMQVTQFFPTDFGGSQDMKKDVDICVFLGSVPSVMIEGFVWFSSFCWHYQHLLPLFYDTSVRQQWPCQIVSYFPQFSIYPFFL